MTTIQITSILKRMFAISRRGRLAQAGRSSIAMLLLFVSVRPLAATDYFVRQNGHDEAPGTSTHAAWRTIERVNHARLHPGDRVRFEAAATFTGNLLLSAEDAGTSTSP